MPRPRRYLLPILLLLPVNFVCAKLLLTQNYLDGFDVRIGQRGWPWVFLETADLGMPNSALDITLFRFWPLVADLAVLGGIVTLAGALIAWHYRRHDGQFQISLRAVMVMIALFAIGLSWWFHEWNYSRRQEAFLKTFGEAISSLAKSPGPLWLRRLTGNEKIFERIVSIYDMDGIPPKRFKDSLPAAIADLPTIRRYEMFWVPSREEEMTFLRPFTELRPCGSFDEQTVSLLAQLPNLRVLDVAHLCSLTDTQMRELAALQTARLIEATDGNGTRNRGLSKTAYSQCRSGSHRVDHG